MKAKKIPLVIGLMAISLLGLIVLQIFWIKYSLKVEQQQFDNRVSLALDGTINELDKDEMFSFMMRKMGRPPHPLRSMAILQNDFFFLNDSNDHTETEQDIRLEIKELVDNRIKNRDSVEVGLRLQKNTTDTVLIFDPGSTNHSQDVYFFKDRREKPHDIQVDTVISEEYELRINTRTDSLVKSIRNRSGRMRKLLHKMAVEFTIDEESREPDLDLVDSLLRDNFENQKIDANYHFFIANRKGDTLAKESSVDRSRIYETNLFPNSFFDHGVKLFISISNRNELIHRGVMAIVAISLLFSLLIILTFAYTLRLILNQKKLSEIKNDFINNITHEFKTPIATTRIALDAMGTENVLSNQKRIKHFTRIIREENERMDGQVELVLRSATSEQKDLELSPVMLNLNSLVQSAIGHINLIVESRGGSIQFEPQDDLPDLLLDESHFESAILNILDNANKYSTSAPTIEVKTFQSGNIVFLTIKDFGIGMDSKTQKKIFDKFYRVPTGDLHNVKGFGLGLNYVKSVLDKLDGDISVRSSIGKGTVFTIKFKAK